MSGLPSGWTDIFDLAEVYLVQQAESRERGDRLSSPSAIHDAEQQRGERLDVLARIDTLVEAAPLESLQTTQLEEADIIAWREPEHPPPLLDGEVAADAPVAGLAAALEIVGLVELLQLLERGRCSGTIHIEASAGSGKIEVHDGQVVAAAVLRQPAEGELLEVPTVPGVEAVGATRIVEAVRQMIPWCAGQVHYTPRRATSVARPALPIQRLLMAALID